MKALHSGNLLSKAAILIKVACSVSLFILLQSAMLHSAIVWKQDFDSGRRQWNVKNRPSNEGAYDLFIKPLATAVKSLRAGRSPLSQQSDEPSVPACAAMRKL